ncbi:hypothetical protein PPYR_11103 [Photinus pyralis]|uniref:Cardioactive peptide n=1 Tax=Photinus pyralis TaxID=7054 RepID=A0A5N3ZYD7_PHOPY|nr:cardioactive peptide-like isoform X1 [Photinus pyralis]XP_031359178.1 cardioactive peptide-like isoform X1 [Photinus pyralis]KAB0790073.1 hypothetical protein PPYR_15605 [Photinus pyralis]KAB0797042.1 hypothetical protein PPYR_11103 [Photinus pyralis]
MVSSILFVISVSIVMLHQDGLALFLPKRVDPLTRTGITDPKKRPFCNAFTGCGHKRSNLPALTNRGEPVEESIGSLLELSGEPAVEDLSRQIMSEAKLWEAIQEANVELARRKQESAESLDNDPSSPARSATASCALPPCYIK